MCTRNLMKSAYRKAVTAHRQHREIFPFCGTRLRITHMWGKYYGVMSLNNEEIFRLVEEPNGNIWVMEV